jgi:hypothetical protein
MTCIARSSTAARFALGTGELAMLRIAADAYMRETGIAGFRPIGGETND